MALDAATILSAVDQLDQDEPIIRDMIENELMDVAGINRTKVADAINAGRGLAGRIAARRLNCFKEILRLIPEEDTLARKKLGQVWRQDTYRIYSAISIGLTSGDENTDIAHRVIGSRRLNGSNGVTEITRHQLRLLLVD